jgi:hypothetical protein
MLNEKQFRERAKGELRHIGDQVVSLITDRDVYCKLENEVVETNPQLRDRQSAFLDMLRGNYTEAMTVRTLRLLDGEDSGVSLPRVLAQLSEYPQLLHDKMTEREFADDCAALLQAAADVKRVCGPRFSHHERTVSALAPAHRELNRAIDLLSSMVKTYYWILAGSYIDLDAKPTEETMAIFRFAWAVPTLTK